MRTLRQTACGFTLLCAALAPARAEPPLRLIATTSVPGLGGAHHFAADVKNGRLFLAADESSTIEVFDLGSGRHLRSVRCEGHPFTMWHLDDTDRLLVAEGGSSETEPGAVRVLAEPGYAVAASVPLPAGVEHSAFNPADHCFYVESGPEKAGGAGHLVNVIDVSTLSRLGAIAFPGPANEGMAIDRRGERLYVNLKKAANAVAVVDLATREIVAQWPLPDGATVAHALALDEAHRRLFVATRQSPRVVVLSLDSGAVVASLPCAGSNSDMWYDGDRRRIYVSGDGAITVLAQRDPDHYESLGDVPSAHRAKSSYFVPSLGRLYVAAPGGNRPDAPLKLLVFATR